MGESVDKVGVYLRKEVIKMARFVVRFKNFGRSTWAEKKLTKVDSMMVEAVDETEAKRLVKQNILGHNVEIVDCVEKVNGNGGDRNE